jgi:hypothetical protein
MVRYLSLLLFIGLAFWGCESNASKKSDSSNNWVIGEWRATYEDIDITYCEGTMVRYNQLPLFHFG